MTMATSEPRATAPAPTASRRRGAWAAALAAAVVVVAGVVWVTHRHHEVGSAPYTDPASVGKVTLCRDGKPITSGSTKDAPLADVVVSGQRASGALAVAGGTATLFAYQPRQGIDPVSWSGLQLTGATVYGDGAKPTVKPEKNATTLAQFLTGFPAADDGWVQLRVVLGAPGVRAQTTSYATADLHIDGSTWTVADPGTASCP